MFIHCFANHSVTPVVCGELNHRLYGKWVHKTDAKIHILSNGLLYPCNLLIGSHVKSNKPNIWLLLIDRGLTTRSRQLNPQVYWPRACEKEKPRCTYNKSTPFFIFSIKSGCNGSYNPNSWLTYQSIFISLHDSEYRFFIWRATLTKHSLSETWPSYMSTYLCRYSLCLCCSFIESVQRRYFSFVWWTSHLAYVLRKCIYIKRVSNNLFWGNSNVFWTSNKQ